MSNCKYRSLSPASHVGVSIASHTAHSTHSSTHASAVLATVHASLLSITAHSLLPITAHSLLAVASHTLLAVASHALLTIASHTLLAVASHALLAIHWSLHATLLFIQSPLLLHGDILEGVEELELVDSSVGVAVNGPHGLHDLELVDSDRVSHHRQHVVKESHQLIGVQGPASIPIVRVEHLVDVHSQLLVLHLHSLLVYLYYTLICPRIYQYH
jgi:hypothetical protein